MNIKVEVNKEDIKDKGDKVVVSLSFAQATEIEKKVGIYCIKEYVSENIADDSWPDEKIDFVSRVAYEKFNETERGDEEYDCIIEAIEEYKNLQTDFLSVKE